MNKELRALNRIRDFMSENAVNWKQDIWMIEAALKEKEKQDGVLKILKEVISFRKVLPLIRPNGNNFSNIAATVSINIQRDIENKERELLRKWVLENCFPKELKALEIIKEKEVNVFIFLHSGDLETYNDMVEDNRKLTQEEYDLLKEVLL